VTISGGVGPNVTAIVQNQTNQDLTISTAPLLVNLNGTLLANNNTSGTKQLKVLAGGNVSVGGTGDLVLQNNTSYLRAYIETDGCSTGTRTLCDEARV
jgi:hypothetical protein